MTAARAASKAVKREERLMARLNVLMVVASVACLAASCASGLAAESAAKIAPARVEATLDAAIKQGTLTAKAAARPGIQLDEGRADPSGLRIVPYASVLFALTRMTWIYISADPLTFVRG